MAKSDLPFGSEFSPSQVELSEVLDLARRHGGDWKAFEAAVRARYFESYPTSDYNRGKLANNCKLGMIAYGTIDRDAQLTDFGERLWQFRDSPHVLYGELARHILVDLHGLALVQTAQDMEARGEKVTLNKLREWLGERGIVFPRGGKHPSIMRLWLERAGVFFTNSWRVNGERLGEIVGASTEEIERLGSLSPEQRAYLKTLANMGGTGPCPSNEVEQLASLTYGTKFDEKNLPKSVLYPLEAAGFIVLTRGTKRPGRGAKPFLVAPTEKFASEVMTPVIEALERQTGAELRPLLRKPLREILQEVDGEDKYRRGLALEALAFYLMRLVDLAYVATRLRGAATGGAEVDVIFEGRRLMFSRWQVQCKHTASVSLDDVAKEVGLTHMLKSNVVVIVSTGVVGREARRYAQSVMKDSNLQIVLVEREDLGAIRDRPAHVVDVLNREAKRAMEIKRLQLE
ncbi:MAG: restriction endonuclease [Chloroflexi bacterium]|nr:restriction endonuclease [Chloroflexota bacterium]